MSGKVVRKYNEVLKNKYGMDPRIIPPVKGPTSTQPIANASHPINIFAESPEIGLSFRPKGAKLYRYPVITRKRTVIQKGDTPIFKLNIKLKMMNDRLSTYACLIGTWPSPKRNNLSFFRSEERSFSWFRIKLPPIAREKASIAAKTLLFQNSTWIFPTKNVSIKFNWAVAER